jgi:glycine dehydrogenase
MPSHPDRFVDRHIGPRQADLDAMLRTLSCRDIDELVSRTVPASIRSVGEPALPLPLSEVEAMAALGRMAQRNATHRSYIGLGYHGTVVPAVLRRNILENPGWYTQYTPYQAEIAQGRLEALLNFQTMVISLTGLGVANASLLDEATAAAEAMTLCARVLDKSAEGKCFFVSERCHPQTIALVATRAEPLGIEVVVGDHETWDFSKPTFGALVPYPATDGEIVDYTGFAKRVHDAEAKFVVAADLLALTILRPPAEFGADDGIRRPARRVHGRARRVQAPNPGSRRRRLEGRGRPAGLQAGAADARAAHPPRQGDQQHLHGAGPARGDGRNVRGLPRA